MGRRIRRRSIQDFGIENGKMYDDKNAGDLLFVSDDALE